MGLEERKRELRGRMRAARGALPAADRAERGARIEERVLDLLSRSETVMLFYAFGDEVPTRSLANALHERGVRLLLPFVDEGGMEAADVLPGDPLDPSTYGPREPATRVAADPRGIDAVVVPGLAFDREGRRLGYGGGHYDRYLTRLRSGATTIGIAFSFQVVEEVPAGPRDVAVRIVATEDEVIIVGGA